MIKVTSLTSVSPLGKLSLNFQYLLFLGLVSAAPRPDSPPVYVPSEPYKAAPPPPRAYKPAPAPYKEEELPPQPYEYKYGVADDYSKSTYDKAETQDEYGNVQGSYKVRKCSLLVEMSKCVFYCLVPDQSSRWPGPDCELCVRQGWVQSRREL